jgi:WD40 repeat protein
VNEAGRARHRATCANVKGVLALVAMLYACLGSAQGQEQNQALLYPQLRRSAGVNCVAFSPDGTQLATGSFDNSA